MRVFVYRFDGQVMEIRRSAWGRLTVLLDGETVAVGPYAVEFETKGVRKRQRWRVWTRAIGHFFPVAMIEVERDGVKLAGLDP